MADESKMPDLRAPLVISVTGHRKIDPEDRIPVQEKVEFFLNKLKKDYPYTELILQTSLSPGADQIAALAAKNCNVNYRVIQPCDEELYKEKSFGDMAEEHWTAFLELKNGAGERIVLPDMGGGDMDRFKFQLFCSTAYQIATSHIIIAMWDGYDSHLPGGTSYLVESAHDGVDPQILDKISHLYSDGNELHLGDGRVSREVSYLNVREDALIYHIPTGREGDSRRMEYLNMPPVYYVPRPVFEDERDRRGQSSVTYNEFGWRGSKEIPAIYTEIFGNVDHLNKEVLELVKKSEFEEFKKNSADKLFGFGAFDTYLSTQENLTRICRENSGKNLGSEEEYRKQGDALEEYIRKLRKDSKKQGVLLDLRLAFWRKFMDQLNCRSDGWAGKHVKKLKQKRKKRNAVLLELRMASEYKDNRSGSNAEEYIKQMKQSRENAGKVSDEVLQKITPDSKGPQLDLLRYSVVDELALNYRDTNAREVTTYTVFTALTSFFLALYLIPNNSVLFTGMYIFFSLFAAIVIYWNRTRKVQSQYLDYRTLAESLRVKVYWNLLGISYSGNSDSYSYLRNEMMWVNSVFKSWHTVADRMPTDTLRNYMDFCECTWVADQFNYHEMKIVTVGIRNLFSKNLALFFLALGTLLSVNSFLLELTDVDVTKPMIKVVSGTFWAKVLGDGTVLTHDNLLKISVATANLIYAALLTYLTKLIYGGTRKSMQMKVKMYRTAFKRYSDFVSDIEVYRNTGNHSKDQVRRYYIECVNIFRELGAQALEEVNSWAALHRLKRVSNFFDTYKNAK